MSMSLLENDYLGSSGSRGYGKISFNDIKIYWNSKDNYENGNTDLESKNPINVEVNTLSELIKRSEEIKTRLSG